jgi:hypothetical protein
LGGALDTAPVLREFLKSAKGAAARRQTVKELRGSLGGALDTAPVLREFLKSAKGAVARRQTVKELRRSLGGALDTAPVLREFLKSSKPKPKGSDAVPPARVFLELRATVRPTWDDPDPSDYITPLSGSVCLPANIEDGDHVVIGSIKAYLVHLDRALNDREDWFDVLDSHSADTALYLDLFEAGENAYSDWVQSAMETFSSDLLVLDRIRIEPQYRGSGYGLYAAALMIQDFGPAGGIVACVPSPYELAEGDYGSPFEDAMGRGRAERIPGWAQAETKLRAFWSLLGFQQVPESEVFALSLALRQPKMKETMRKYFERKKGSRFS